MGRNPAAPGAPRDPGFTSISAPSAPDDIRRQPRVCVLAGSPRAAGNASVLAEHVARGVRAQGCRADVVRLADHPLAGCTGCGACERTGTCVLPADGWAALQGALEAADGLALVAPVYFAGPPSQLKALFDRMQPLWSQRYLLGRRPLVPLGERRPLDLFVVGSGGDPFGYEPLVTSARSALRMMDFELDQLRAFIGYRTPARAGAPAHPDDAALERAATAGGADLARRLLARAACAPGPAPAPACASASACTPDLVPAPAPACAPAPAHAPDPADFSPVPARPESKD